jgi:hypothetical protein
MATGTNTDFIRFFRYFFGAVLAIYGLFAFLDPAKYPIIALPPALSPFIGLVLIFIGLAFIFYKNE